MKEVNVWISALRTDVGFLRWVRVLLCLVANTLLLVLVVIAKPLLVTSSRTQLTIVILLEFPAAVFPLYEFVCCQLVVVSVVVHMHRALLRPSQVGRV